MMWKYNLYLCVLAIRYRLLKHTRLNVVAFLNELPKTQHDIASFTIDVNTYTVSSCLFFYYCLFCFVFFNSKSLTSFCKILHSQNTLLAFTVSGIFKEGELCFRLFLSSCSTHFFLLCLFVSSVFQLLSMQNPENPPWLSLACSSQSQLEIQGKFTNSAKMFITALQKL